MLEKQVYNQKTLQNMDKCCTIYLMLASKKHENAVSGLVIVREEYELEEENMCHE